MKRQQTLTLDTWNTTKKSKVDKPALTSDVGTDSLTIEMTRMPIGSGREMNMADIMKYKGIGALYWSNETGHLIERQSMLINEVCTGQVQQDTFFREFSNSIGDRPWFAECSLSRL